VATPKKAGAKKAGGKKAGGKKAGGTVAGLVLTPGASAGRDQPALVAVDAAVSSGGVKVERIDFPYHLAGRRAPDRPPVLIATVVDEAGALAAALGVGTDRIALGGRSMGGRMCSMAVAGGLACAGLVLISYPLHPPGRPDRPRTEHLGALGVPCLFVSGTRDAFGSPGELEAATAVIPGPVTHVWIEGGDHGLKGKDAAVADAVASWIAAV
jgi:predicted alpha/beta-hydrolase family hydrolase